MLKIIEKSIEAVTPHVLGLEAVGNFPEADCRDSIAFQEELFETGVLEFRAATMFAFLALNLFSLLKKGRTFPRLEASAQSEIIERVFSSGSKKILGVAQLLSLAAATAYYSREDVQKLLGFDVAALKEETELRHVSRYGKPLPPKGSDEATKAEEHRPTEEAEKGLTDKMHAGERITEDLRLSTEVVVIGSGCGGATLAKELSSEGRSVLLLEAGDYLTRDDFNMSLHEAYTRMYWYGGQVFTVGRPMVIIPQGRTVGGSTTINSGTCFRMPHRVLKKWHLDFGLWDITEEEMGLLYAAVEEYLMVKKADEEVVGRNSLLFLEGAKKLGLSGGLLKRNAKECEGYGVCVLGCPSDAKQSCNVSCVPDALKSGCDLYTRCVIEEIAIKGGRAVGVRGRFLDRAGKPGPGIEVEAEVVVLAAGALHTPRMLQVQGICNSSGQVGSNLTIHPMNGIMAIVDENLESPKGIPQGAYVDEFASDGVLLLEGAAPPAGMAIGLPKKGRRHAELMWKYPYMATFGGQVSEVSSDGRVTPHPLDSDRYLIRYNLGDEDAKKFKFVTEIAAEIFFSVGAKTVFTQTRSFHELSSPRDLRSFKTSKLKVGDYIGATAYHPLGTCRMGSDPEESVVKHTGETWDVENLFICDGSIIPTSLGVNPQMTLFALAMRCAGFVDDKLEPRAGRNPSR